MSEERLRLAALTVVGGPLDGRRHEPAEVVTEILVGADPDCHLSVDLPSISPIHARLWADLDQVQVYDTRAPRGLWVNESRVEGHTAAGKGDVLWLGPPLDPQSVCVRLDFLPWVEVLPASPVQDETPGPPAEAYEAILLGEDGQLEEPARSEPAAAEEEAAPPDDPFFVGESGGTPFPAPRAVTRPPLPPLDTEAPVVAPQAPPAPVTAAEDEWVIAEAQPVNVPVGEHGVSPAPEEAAPDDAFFVAPEPTPSETGAAEVVEVVAGVVAGEEAVFVEAEPLEATPAPQPEPSRPLPARPPAAAPPSPGEGAPAPPSPAPRAAEAPAPRAERPGAERPVSHRPVPRPRAVAPARRPPARAVAHRRSGGLPGWARPVGIGVAALAAAAALGFGAWALLGGGVRIDAIDPARVRVGQRATLRGGGFSADPAGNTVLFDEREARVLQASADRLEVEVPEVVSEVGSGRRVSVVVRRGRHASPAVEATVFQGPRLHGLAPEAAMPGEEVLLAGAGWGLGASVRFGDTPAEVLEVDAVRIRAIVPPIPGGTGTSAPVVVSVGGVESNPAPFVVGHLPVLTGLAPASAVPGEVVAVSGLGFERDPLLNDVRVGGVPALVVSAREDGLTVVVPWVGPGDSSRTLEVRRPGSPEVGLASLQVAPAADPVAFQFAAEPFTAVPGRPHAVLSTGLGPAFVLAGSGGRSAADRALEAQGRLNAAAQALRSTLGLSVEARSLGSSPVIGLAGRPDVLLEVTPEDAAAYNEDWSGLRGRGGPVTPARLARWWEAVARDLVLLTVRGERPRFAAALAPEGRALQQLSDAAQKTGRPGVPLQVVNEARPALRDGLRLIALRVPASVTAPAPGAAAAASPATAAAAATPPARLQLEGTWAGSEVEQGERRYLTTSFRRGGGTLAYEGGITLTLPLLAVEQTRRDQVRFSVEVRGSVRHYDGKWDGEILAGSVSTDAAGTNVVATFELRRR